MTLSRCVVLVLLVLSHGTAPAHASTWVVDPNGGGDFLTIQIAIDSTAAGDTVLVRPGTYPEAVHITQNRSGMVVKGDGPAEDVVVQGDQYVAALISGTDPPARLERLTLSGYGTYGALWVQDARAQIVDCVIRGNNGPGGCHGVGGGGRVMLMSDVLVEGCLIEDNHDWESPGGLIVWQSHAEIRRNVFRNNASCYGGGLEIYHCETTGVSVIEENVFVGNSADIWGGGLFTVDSSPLIRRNTFVDNGGSAQAGIWVLGGKPRIESNLIVGNRWAVYCQTEGGYPASLPVIGDNLCWRIAEASLTNCAPAGGLQVADPLFCHEQGGDLRLCSDSPAIQNGEVIYGALGVGCPDCKSTPVRRTSWGAVKALYGPRKRE